MSTSPAAGSTHAPGLQNEGNDADHALTENEPASYHDQRDPSLAGLGLVPTIPRQLDHSSDKPRNGKRGSVEETDGESYAARDVLGVSYFFL